MNDTTNGQVRLYMDECANTSVFYIDKNIFAEVSISLSSDPLVGFKKNLQALSEAIVKGASDVDLSNKTIII